jgi:preprotein translocase subunit SecD
VSDRRKYLLILGVIVAALAGAALLAVPGSPIYQKPVLGLDLQGGLEVVLQAEPATKGQKITPDELDKSVSIMESRINKLGVSEPEIRKQGSNQIVIQLAGVHNQAKAAELIGKTAQLMIFDFEPDLASPSKDARDQPVAATTLYGLLKQVQDQAAKGEPQSYYLFRNKSTTTPSKKKGGKPTTTTTHSVKNSAPTLNELLKPYGGKVPAGSEVLKVPPHRLVRRLAERDVLLPLHVLAEHRQRAAGADR